MKKNILIICFITNVLFCKAQLSSCNVSTITPTDIFFAGPAYNYTTSVATQSLYLCPNSIVYDTTSTSCGDREAVMINAGANYIWKPCGSAASLIYVKNGGTLTFTLGGSTYTEIYFEPGSTIINLTTAFIYTYLCSSLSFPVINCLASVHDLEKENLNFSVYPNPVSSSIYLNLQSDISETVNITFSNQIGETVLQYPSWNSSKKEIPVNNLSNGVYFISIESKGVSRSKKIVVLK